MDYKIALANLVNGALLGYSDNTKVMEYKKIVEDEIKHCYCNRTDCSGRIKESKTYPSLQEEYENLKQIEKEHQKENGRLREENEFLMKKDNVLQSLKQWLKERIKEKPLLTTFYIKELNNKTLSSVEKEELELVLYKIEELEGE